MADVGVVNGPEDELLDWHAVDWRAVEEDVQRLRQVTELNAGRKTAGVDGKVVLLSSVKAEMAGWVQRHTGPWQARPVKRVYIPKKGQAGVYP